MLVTCKQQDQCFGALTVLHVSGVFAAGFHIDNGSPPHPASRFMPQDVALSMLQLLFLTTRQLVIAHQFNQAGVHFSQNVPRTFVNPMFGIPRQAAAEYSQLLVEGQCRTSAKRLKRPYQVENKQLLSFCKTIRSMPL